MKKFDCTKLGTARKLVQFIKVEIPVDFAPEAAGHGQAVSEIRRRFSNYDALAANLPACPCPNAESYDFECPNRAMAHDTLMWAANGLVELAYREWQANQAG